MCFLLLVTVSILEYFLRMVFIQDSLKSFSKLSYLVKQKEVKTQIRVFLVLLINSVISLIEQ